MPRYARAVLGGTFDRFHIGHEALLATAFRLGREVGIGVTTAEYLRAHPKPDGRRIASFRARRSAVTRWAYRTFPGRRFSIHPLRDPFGGSVGPRVSVLVVSADTAVGGARVNRERTRLGRPTVPVVTVPLALADDLEPVSSRRIRSGEIDRHGRRRSPIRVGLSLNDAGDRAWATRAVRRVFPTSQISVVRDARRGRRGPARPVAGLQIRLRRRADGTLDGWEASPSVRLGPFRLGPVGPRRLERELAERLRPSGRRS